MQIKQHSKFKYVGCLLDETMSGKAIALNIVNIIHNKPKSVYCKINFLMPVLRRLLCNALIQPHFDYACSSCYPNLTKKLNIEFKLLKTSVCIFLQLDKLKNIPHEEFKCLNWLPVTYRYKRCVNAIVFQYFNEQCHSSLNEVFHVAIENNLQLRSSFQKLKCPFRKNNTGQLLLSYIRPTFWNKKPDTLKCNKNFNTLKHNFKKNFLNELKNCKNPFSNLYLFSTVKNPHSHLLQILILEVLWLRDHNLNTSFCKHVLCHPANNKCFLNLFEYSISHEYA